MNLGIPVYDGVNMLDVIGPAEMFFWAGRNNPLNVLLLSEDGLPRTSINGVTFNVDASFSEVSHLDILWVPGGSTRALGRIMSEPASQYLSYLEQTARTATWVCSVCEGALLAAKAGILDGHRITTHWAFVNCFSEFTSVEVVSDNPRYVVSGNRLTGAGVSAGIDQALKLIELLFGTQTAESVQRTTEYYPNPPVSGELPNAGPCPVQWGA